MKLSQSIQKWEYRKIIQFLKDSDAYIIDITNHLAELNVIPKTLVNDINFYEAVKAKTDEMFVTPNKTGYSLQDFIETYEHLIDNDLPFPAKTFMIAPFSNFAIKLQVEQSIKEFIIQEANERFGRFLDLDVMFNKEGVEYEHTPHTEPLIMNTQEDYKQHE